MKELYTSPEMNIVCFAPVEQLAGNTVLWEDLLKDPITGESYDGASNNNPLDIEAELEDA